MLTNLNILNLKIISSIFLAFSISLSLLFGFQFWAKSTIDTFQLQENFFNQHFDQHKKIFLFGSSEVANLNSTYIHNSITPYQYEFYNLGVPADNPIERLQTLDRLLSLKPDIIIYGIGIRDFIETSNIDMSIEKPENALPEIQDLYYYFQFNSIHLFESPKFLSLKVFDFILFNLLGISDNENIIKDRTPFYVHGTDVYEIKNNDEIISDFYSRPVIDDMIPALENKNFIAFTQILDTLKKNNVKVIVFTTPKHSVYFENLSENNQKNFDELITLLSNSYFTIHRFDDKYVNQTIWYDYRHVAVNEQSLSFTKDVTNLIINSIEN